MMKKRNVLNDSDKELLRQELTKLASSNLTHAEKAKIASKNTGKVFTRFNVRNLLSVHDMTAKNGKGIYSTLQRIEDKLDTLIGLLN